MQIFFRINKLILSFGPFIIKMVILWFLFSYVMFFFMIFGGDVFRYVIFRSSRYANVIVIAFYSSSCLGQETAKGPFGLRVKLPPAHLFTTHGGGFTLSL